jgi:hypothetical protein
MMYILAGLFWLFGLIPGVNVISNAIYWVIWLFVFIFKYLPLIKSIAKTGTSIGKLGFKIGVLTVISFILGEIPIISLIPWDMIASFYINKWIKQALVLVEKIKKDAEKLKAAWKFEKQKQKARMSSRRAGNSVGLIPDIDDPDDLTQEQMIQMMEELQQEENERRYQIMMERRKREEVEEYEQQRAA